jgi:hypothetical protein
MRFDDSQEGLNKQLTISEGQIKDAELYKLIELGDSIRAAELLKQGAKPLSNAEFELLPEYNKGIYSSILSKIYPKSEE